EQALNHISPVSSRMTGRAISATPNDPRSSTRQCCAFLSALTEAASYSNTVVEGITLLTTAYAERGSTGSGKEGNAMKTVMADKQWAKAYPELGTGPVPAEPCISPAYFELERERGFRRVWLNMGRVEASAKPGDYVVRDLAVCNTSILLMRGDDGVVRGFHNVCSHRGNKLAGEGKGSRRKYLTCNFHSWSYDSQGQLKWVPDEENFFDLQKSQHGLTPVATEIWAGFIFINLSPRPQESLTAYLGGVAERLGGGRFDEL